MPSRPTSGSPAPVPSRAIDRVHRPGATGGTMYGKQMASLEGKVALVTGASSGMGEEITKAMAAAGAGVVAVGRNKGRLERVVADAENAGGGAVVAVVRDLTEESAAQAVVDEAIDRLGRLDVLANVAGIME